MIRAHAILRADKLMAETRCPVCGDRRVEAIGAKGTPLAFVRYKCSATFCVDGNGEIIPTNVCPNSSYTAARALNTEALAEVRKVAGAPVTSPAPATSATDTNPDIVYDVIRVPLTVSGRVCALYTVPHREVAAFLAAFPEARTEVTSIRHSPDPFALARRDIDNHRARSTTTSRGAEHV